MFTSVIREIVLAEHVVFYPAVSEIWVAAFVGCVLIAICNRFSAQTLWPQLARVVTWWSPAFLLLLAGFPPVPGHLHSLLGWSTGNLSESYVESCVGVYIYLALGFAFSLANVRVTERRFRINGIVFMLIFGLLITLNILSIIKLWQQVIRAAGSPG